MKGYQSFAESVSLGAEESRELKRKIREIKKEFGPKKIWKNEIFVLIFTATMALIDGVVLYSLTDTVLTQSYYLSILLTFAVACVLNFSCMPMGYSIEAIIHSKGKARAKHIIILVGLLAVFIVIYVFVSVARFNNSESLYENTTTVTTTLDANSLKYANSNTNGSAATYDPNEFEEIEEDNGEVWFTWLLIIEPLGTSMLALLLSMASSSVVSEEIIRCTIKKAKLEKKRQSLINAKERNRGFDGSEADDIDEEQYKNIQEILFKRAEKLKKDQLVYLAEALKDPGVISK